MENESKKKIFVKQAGVKIPRYKPGHPPENYNLKKSISIFACIYYLGHGFKCPELLRASITSKGDVYVVPSPKEGLGDFHFSYHKSGKFHWGWEGKHIQPICGEDDSPAMMRLWLKLKKSPCICFRKGKNLNVEEIFMLLQKLAPNLPFTFNIEKVSHDLKDSNSCRFTSPELNKWEIISDLLHGRLIRFFKRLSLRRKFVQTI